MSAYSENVHQEPHFTDLPFLNEFSKWFTSIFQMPSGASTWFAQIILLLLTWYTMKFTFRLVMSIVWPLVIISTVLVIFHSIKHGHGMEFYVCDTIVGICNWMVSTFVKVSGFFAHS